MSARTHLMLLITVSLLIFSACRKEEEKVWTLQMLAETPCTANVYMNVKLLDSTIGDRAFRVEDDSFKLEPVTLSLGSDENVVTLRFNRSDLQYLEIPLRQMTKIGNVAYLDLTESPLHLKYPSKSEDFDVVAILKSSNRTPKPGRGPYSVEFQTQAGTLRIWLKMEILCTPKPGVKREKQHYGGTVLIDVLPKS